MEWISNNGVGLVSIVLAVSVSLTKWFGYLNRRGTTSSGTKGVECQF